MSANDAKTILPFLFKQAIDQNLIPPGVFEQYVVFTDARTGRTDENDPLLVTQSGFKITAKPEQVMMGGQKVYRMVVQRTAKANNGVEAGVVSDADAKEVIAVIK